MAIQNPLTKHTYQFAAEPVHSDNLNEIQDAVVELQEQWADPADVTALETKVDALSADVSDAYNPASTYLKGDYCIYNNTLYRCTTEITTAEAWNAAHWTATTVAKEIKNRTLFYQAQGVSAGSGTIVTIDDDRITENHVLMKFVPANGSAVTSGITCTTSAGRAILTGTCMAATTAEIVLQQADNQ